MSAYKLIYFNSRGRAEPARFVFAQAGVQYEDKRVTGEEFGEMKSSLPTGALPVLEVDGKQLTGSAVITRYLGETLGLAGANEFENAQLAAIMDVVSDLGACVIPVLFGKDDETKAEAKKKLLEESIPKYFGILEARIKANNAPEGWIFGQKITYVDMTIVDCVAVLSGVDKDVLGPYPCITKLNEAVTTQPKIADWIKDRPETPY